MPTADLDARFVTLASFVVSRHTTRYGLNGVNIYPAEHRTGAYIFATDGHRALACYDETAEVDQAFVMAVSPELRKAVFTRSISSNCPRVEIVRGGGALLHVRGGGTVWNSTHPVVMECDPVKGWRAVLPTNHAGAAPSGVGSFNAKSIKDFAEIANKIRKLFHGQNEPGTMRIKGADDHHPVEITFGQHPIYGVLMPMRSYYHEHDVSFLNDCPEDAATHKPETV